MFKSIIFICFTLIIILPMKAFSWSGNVLKVFDGDSIAVLSNDKKKITIRLYGIDTPEKTQAYGDKAKRFTAEMVEGNIVEVDEIETDKYGRTVGILRLGDKTVNEEIVREGYAWVYQYFCKKSICSTWLELENIARKKEIGLWKDQNPIAPWKWKKKTRVYKEKDIISIKGKVRYIDVEGGFWGIVSDDGQQYDPIDLPSALKMEGVTIEGRVIPRTGMMSIRMWGTIVQIVDIKRMR